MASISYRKRAQISAIIFFAISIILFAVGGILYGISEKTVSLNFEIDKKKVPENINGNLLHQRLPNISEILLRKLGKLPKFLQYNFLLKREREKMGKNRERLQECSRIIFVVAWGNIFLCPIFICLAIYYNTKDKRDTTKTDKVRIFYNSSYILHLFFPLFIHLLQKKSYQSRETA